MRYPQAKPPTTDLWKSGRWALLLARPEPALGLPQPLILNRPAKPRPKPRVPVTVRKPVREHVILEVLKLGVAVEAQRPGVGAQRRRQRPDFGRQPVEVVVDAVAFDVVLAHHWIG